MSIGEVLALLKPEFPDISISKIRFLESEGLVEPQRSASGYRKFAAGDLDRLRFVLRLQRDRYLPLRVIKEQLEAVDSGLEPPPVPEADREEPATVTVRLTRAELIAAAGIDEARLTRLQEYGLITPFDGGTAFDGDALIVARLVTALGRYGLEPRHLRQIKAAADREAALVEQIVAPLLHRRGADARTGAEQAVRELLALTSRFHTVMVDAALRPTLGR
jgi:DNA-binding transcriptional MerR regulator